MRLSRNHPQTTSSRGDDALTSAKSQRSQKKSEPRHLGCYVVRSVRWPVQSRTRNWPRRLAGCSLLVELICCLMCNFGIDFTSGQNIVGEVNRISPANPAKLTNKDVSEFFSQTPRLGTSPVAPEAIRCRAKLERHIEELLAAFPFRPFHHTLGISGYEVYFNHPDEMFYSLALAWPFLSDATGERVKTFMRAQANVAPPYAVDGWDNRLGRPRESYTVPDNLRRLGKGKAASAFGVYAFWAWCHYAQDAELAREHWPRIKARVKPLLAKDYVFDINRRDFKQGEPETLNGDLAGLLGVVRLAKLNGDETTERHAEARARQLLELRVNLERVNPGILEHSNLATKGLHNFRLSRYCDLVPEVGQALHKWTDGRGAAYLQAFRQERNGWYLAFGDRLIGGENYTNPLHFSRALFAGAVLVEQLPAEPVLTFIDVPWCPADFYFIEKCALALWVSSGHLGRLSRKWPKASAGRSTVPAVPDGQPPFN